MSCDLGIVAQKPEGGRVGFPPEDCGGGGDEVWDCELGGDYAALMVGAHEETHYSVEDDPGC